MKRLISLPITAYLIYRSHTHGSLTPPGIVFAALTALIHSAHPSPLPFTLLVVFFLAGTTATKVKHEVKSSLTVSSDGWNPSSRRGEGGAGGRSSKAEKTGAGRGRTHVQVLANSGMATLLVLLHLLWHVYFRPNNHPPTETGDCIPTTGSTAGLLLAGIVANYAAVAADTFSSELGILSDSAPRLITRPWTKVPRGTNGGVTATGLGAGILGAFIIATTSAVLMPFCPSTASGLGPVGRVLMAGEQEAIYRGWSLIDKSIFVAAVTIWGALGSVLDSFLGAVFQASVVDRRTGKIVEASGGEKVLVSHSKGRVAKRSAVHAEGNKDEAFRKRREVGEDEDEGTTGGGQEHTSRTVLVGMDWLDNNQVNILMAASMSLGGMGVAAWWWGMEVGRLWS